MGDVLESFHDSSPVTISGAVPPQLSCCCNNSCSALACSSFSTYRCHLRSRLSDNFVVLHLQDLGKRIDPALHPKECHD